jgi:hypothetical protein
MDRQSQNMSDGYPKNYKNEQRSPLNLAIDVYWIIDKLNIIINFIYVLLQSATNPFPRITQEVPK